MSGVFSNRLSVSFESFLLIVDWFKRPTKQSRSIWTPQKHLCFLPKKICFNFFCKFKKKWDGINQMCRNQQFVQKAILLKPQFDAKLLQSMAKLICIQHEVFFQRRAFSCLFVFTKKNAKLVNIMSLMFGLKYCRWWTSKINSKIRTKFLVRLGPILPSVSLIWAK